MSARVRPALVCALALVSLGPAGAPARADVFGSISLQSVGSVHGGRTQQAEYAHDAVISGDGRYLAFDGAVGGVTGIWRRDLATGSLERVAGGDAELPSISEDGRYVSFTSSEDLVPEDGAHGPNVWVRDMEPGAGEPEYELASAVDGSEEALSYEYSEPKEEAAFGSVAAGRSAISADGREVAFVTTAVSDLAGPATPPYQVAVRYLESDRTVLVSGRLDPVSGQTTDEPVPASEKVGAVYPGSRSRLGFAPVPANGEWAGDPPPGASISADGTTVAWMGANVAEQAPMLSGEHPPALYVEPLWRRIAPGSQTPTELVTGGPDPANPACAASGETSLPPREQQSAGDACQGPFESELATNGGLTTGIWPEANAGVADFVPRLSGNGEVVAFVSSAQRTGAGLGFSSEFGQPADLYVSSMGAGLSRAQALTPLTEVGGVNEAANSPITDFAISADGRQVAFTTRRTRFALGAPAYISPPATAPGESELYEADLDDGTVTRVTHGYGGEAEPSEQTHGSLLQCGGGEDPYCEHITVGAQSPSLTRDGRLVAFSSTASNLVFGDGNSPRNPFGTPEGEFDGSDAFLAEREVFAPTPTPQEISPAPAPALSPSWLLGVTAQSRPNGTVALYAQVPGAGALRAGAAGSVVVRKQAKRGRRARRTVATRTVATRAASAAAPGLKTLTLTLARRYGALARARGGFSATVTVTFTAPHRTTLRERLTVTFRRVAKHKAKKHAAKRRKRRSRR